MSYPIFIYDAFTKEKFGGNAAGIVLDAENLSTVEKQNLAKELGFSETVFVQRSEKADFQLEYFTPKQEVDLCGHATIAAIYALFDEKRIAKDRFEISMETRVGILSVFWKEEIMYYVPFGWSRMKENYLGIWKYRRKKFCLLLV